MSLVPDNKHRLSLVSDLHVVGLVEVLGNTDLLAISQVEESVAWSKIESDIMHDVGSLDGIVSNDTLPNKLTSHLILELGSAWRSMPRVVVHLISDFINSI
jgi:hypothetical protein